MSIKAWYAKLVCLHFWKRGFQTDQVYGRGIEYSYNCLICTKEIRRFCDPINGITELPLKYTDPRYNLSPPMHYINDGEL